MNPNQLDLPREVAREFRRVVRERAPGLKLGRLTFEGRLSYYDFAYHGNGVFPVGLAPTVGSVNYGKETRAERVKNLREKIDDDGMLIYLTEVTFHELGHALSLADSDPHRINLPNYGFNRQRFLNLPKRKRSSALVEEIRAFAYQRALTNLLVPTYNASVEKLLQLLRRDEWMGVLNESDKRAIYRYTYQGASLESINRRLDELNDALR